tara:strand:+ start:579 stop:887 length:309 start_codon:yes stop_codon:yes gene_type:complete
MASKTTHYCQCSLQKIIKRNPDPPAPEVQGTHKTQPGDTVKKTTTWLPRKHAVPGKWLKLKNRQTGKWEDHWYVTSAGPPSPAAEVEANEREYLHQREKSDV